MMDWWIWIKGMSYSVGSEGVNVHLLGLLTESVLVSPDSLDNGAANKIKSR